jgi:pimeloyl-ACP methyl ester carboxylesterase
MFSLLVVALLALTPVTLSQTVPEQSPFPDTRFLDDTSPGQGLGLAPTPTVESAVGLPGGSSRDTPALPPGVPFGLPLGLAVSSGAALVAVRRRRIRDGEPFYVLVHGHGGSEGDFSHLLGELGVAKDRVVAFDYRTAGTGETSTEASRTADVGVAAAQLDRLIRGLSTQHSNIYALHHSKGGAVGVEMIASIDDGQRPPIDGYRGAALLDPAIASGNLGSLQRLGGVFARIPDNGGFNVFRCVDGGCRDARENLGVAAGISVVAIRNPDAVVTNFTDRPPGLRTFDLRYDGKPSASRALPNPFTAFKRVFEAHGSVLSHETVVDCIKAEVRQSGSCEWKGARPARGSGGRELINLGR